MNLNHINVLAGFGFIKDHSHDACYCTNTMERASHKATELDGRFADHVTKTYAIGMSAREAVSIMNFFFDE